MTFQTQPDRCITNSLHSGARSVRRIDDSAMRPHCRAVSGIVSLIGSNSLPDLPTGLSNACSPSSLPAFGSCNTAFSTLEAAILPHPLRSAPVAVLHGRFAISSIGAIETPN